MGNIGWPQLLIVLVIVLLLFGTKKIKSLGGDLGSAVKGFKKAVSEKDADKDADFDESASKKVEDKTEQDVTPQADLNKQPSKSE